MAIRVGSPKLRHLADRADAVVVQLGGRDLSDAPQSLDGERVQEFELCIGRNLQQPIGFRHSTGHLGEELGAGDANGDVESHFVAYPLTQPDGDVDRRARNTTQATDIQKGLVDREALDQRRRLFEHVEDRSARRGVGRESRLDHDGLRTGLTGPETAHRRPHPERLGLVTGRQHHTATDDHRPPAQLRVVPLLDGGEERVEVGMQDRCASHDTNICSHRSSRNETAFVGCLRPP